MKNFLVISLLLISFLLLFNFLHKKTSSVSINGKTFYVFIASSDDQKTKGLSIYDSLPLDKGMIFPFSKSDYYPFWMKDMSFPIDIIYIQNTKIVDIFENVPAPSNNQQLLIYKPDKKANFVLEVNAGLSKKFNLKKGDSVRINL